MFPPRQFSLEIQMRFLPGGSSSLSDGQSFSCASFPSFCATWTVWVALSFLQIYLITTVELPLFSFLFFLCKVINYNSPPVFFTAFCQVNMSIAILPMSSEFGWSPATVGLIQSSFFWGYLLTQVHYCCKPGIFMRQFLSHLNLSFVRTNISY